MIGIVSQRDLFRGALAQALGYGQHARRKLLDTLFVKDVMAPTCLRPLPTLHLRKLRVC